MKLPETERLPANTTTYLYRMSWEATKAAQRETPGGKCLDDPAIKAFVDDFERFMKALEEDDPAITLVYNALQQELVIAGFEAPPEEKPEADAKPNADNKNTKKKAPAQPVEEERAEPRAPQFAIVSASAGAREGLQALSKKVVEGFHGTSVREDVNGVAWNALGEEPLFVTWKNDRLYCATNADGAKSALADAPAEGARLADEGQFKAVTKALGEKMSGGPTALYYYDLRPSWARAAAKNAGGVIDKLSWRTVDGLAGATFVEGDHFRNRHIWKLNERRSGLFRYSREARLNEAWLKKVPASATELLTGVFDGESLAYMVMGSGMVDEGEEGDDAEPKKSLMIPPGIEGLVKNVGPRYLVYRQARTYGGFGYPVVMPWSDLVVVTELRDAEAFREGLKTLRETLPNVMNTWNYDGQEIVSAMFSAAFVFQPVNLCAVGNELIITTQAQIMKDALDAWRKPGRGIADTPEFASIRNQIPADACFLLYFPPGGFARGMFDTYVPQIQGYLGMTLFGSFWNDEPGAKPPPHPEMGLAPRGNDFARHVTTPTFLAGTDRGDALVFDGTAPVLTTPYYWVTLHAIVHLMPEEMSLFDWLDF